MSSFSSERSSLCSDFDENEIFDINNLELSDEETCIFRLEKRNSNSNINFETWSDYLKNSEINQEQKLSSTIDTRTFTRPKKRLAYRQTFCLEDFNELSKLRNDLEMINKKSVNHIDSVLDKETINIYTNKIFHDRKSNNDQLVSTEQEFNLMNISTDDNQMLYNESISMANSMSSSIMTNSMCTSMDYSTNFVGGRDFRTNQPISNDFNMFTSINESEFITAQNQPESMLASFTSTTSYCDSYGDNDNTVIENDDFAENVKMLHENFKKDIQAPDCVQMINNDNKFSSIEEYENLENNDFNVDDNNDNNRTLNINENNQTIDYASNNEKDQIFNVCNNENNKTFDKICNNEKRKNVDNICNNENNKTFDNLYNNENNKTFDNICNNEKIQIVDSINENNKIVDTICKNVTSCNNKNNKYLTYNKNNENIKEFLTNCKENLNINDIISKQYDKLYDDNILLKKYDNEELNHLIKDDICTKETSSASALNKKLNNQKMKRNKTITLTEDQILLENKFGLHNDVVKESSSDDNNKTIDLIITNERNELNVSSNATRITTKENGVVCQRSDDDDLIDKVQKNIMNSTVNLDLNGTQHLFETRLLLDPIEMDLVADKNLVSMKEKTFEVPVGDNVKKSTDDLYLLYPCISTPSHNKPNKKWRSSLVISPIEHDQNVGDLFEFVEPNQVMPKSNIIKTSKLTKNLFAPSNSLAKQTKTLNSLTKSSGLLAPRKTYVPSDFNMKMPQVFPQAINVPKKVLEAPKINNGPSSLQYQPTIKPIFKSNLPRPTLSGIPRPGFSALKPPKMSTVNDITFKLKNIKK